jgi:hypothetical protein
MDTEGQNFDTHFAQKGLPLPATRILPSESSKLQKQVGKPIAEVQITGFCNS